MIIPRQDQQLKKIRLLMFIGQLSMGGAEQLFMYLVKKLPRDKFEIAVCVCDDAGGELFSEIPLDTKIYALHKKGNYEIIQIILRFYNVVRDFKPDIVYTRMGYANLLAVLAKTFFKCEWPIVANEEHDHRQEAKTFYMKAIAYIECWAYRKVTKVLVPSCGVKHDISREYRINPDKITVVYNSVDMENVQKKIAEEIPQEFEHIYNKPVISAFGRMVYRKGFDDLLKAFTIVHQEIECNLILIGKGEKLCELKALSKRLKISENVFFLDYQENPYKYLARSQVFAFSSLWEGFGNVIVEAMACGIPVVSTECNHGPREIIRTESEGILVPIREPKEMAKALLRVLRNSSMGEKLAKASLDRANDFSVDNMVRDYCIALNLESSTEKL